jgi:type IX secretion system PorP/SprF family membrane protein
MKKSAAALFCMLAVFFSDTAFSQDFNFNILPLSIDPAFTGLFNGRLRASALYKNQWSASKVSFNAYGASVDATVIAKQTGYLAVGAAFLEGRSGDGSFKNISSVASVAYHKIISKADKKPGRRCDIGVGIQAGYIQRSINLSGFDNTVPPFVYHVGSGANYYVINAGLSFSQSLSKNFNYTLGLSGNNLNLLNDGTITNQNPLLRITASGTSILAAIWTITDRLNVRPAILHIINKDFYVAGSEFRYKTGNTDLPNTPFISVWYRTGKVIAVNLGYEFRDFRVGAGFDNNLSKSGTGGFQMVARYIMPKLKGTKAEKQALNEKPAE